MGMYDVVVLSCPLCKEKLELQSKAGQCRLTEYSLDSAPPVILGDLDGQSITCNNCGTELVLHVRMIAIPVVVRLGGRNV